ncbi:hypothetical protein VTI74DRAFT_7041 [Chaetomium olivicolor]
MSNPGAATSTQGDVYEIMTGSSPYSELSDVEIKERYQRGKFAGNWFTWKCGKYHQRVLKYCKEQWKRGGSTMTLAFPYFLHSPQVHQEPPETAALLQRLDGSIVVGRSFSVSNVVPTTSVKHHPVY